MKSKANRRSARTIVQWVMGGGLTGLVALMSEGLSPRWTALILGASAVAVTWCMNYAEDHKMIPTIFPSPQRRG